MGCGIDSVSGRPAASSPFAVVYEETQTVGAVESTRTWISLPVGGWVEFRARIAGTRTDADSGAYRAQEGHGGRTAAAGLFTETPIDVPGGFSGATAGAPVPGQPMGWLLNAADFDPGVGLRWGVIGNAGETIDWVIVIEVFDLGGGAQLL
jgi:hypothetical protein